MRAEAHGKTFASLIERDAGLAPKAMDRRRIAEFGSKERAHRLEHFLSYRSGRCVIQIDG